MTAFHLVLPAGAHLLLLGAHSDDIEIGAGGTVLELLARRPDLKVTWVVFSGDPMREAEARASASAFCQLARMTQIETHTFRDGFFPYDGAAVKATFDALGARVSPDLILTHRGNDCHQDHRLVSELTWNTFRPATILEYEIPKYDGDLGQPNVFVPLASPTMARKIELLATHFPSQHTKSWYSADTFRGLARIRGVESGLADFAEGFYARKIVAAIAEMSTGVV